MSNFMAFVMRTLGYVSLLVCINLMFIALTFIDIQQYPIRFILVSLYMATILLFCIISLRNITKIPKRSYFASIFSLILWLVGYLILEYNLLPLMSISLGGIK